MKRISTATRVIDKFGAGKPGFTNGNAATGVAATDLEDKWFDGVQESICRTIEEAGIALSDADMDQFVVALKTIVENKLVASSVAAGTANAITATVDSVLTALVAGHPITIMSSAANTGPVTATLTLGTTVLAALPIVKGNNLALAAGDIPAAGYPLRMNYSPAFGAIVLLNPAGGLTNVVTAASDPTFANNSGSSASTSWVRGAMSAIASAAGFASSLGTNGYVKLPSWLGGVVFQWGTTAVVSTTSTVTVTLPLTFPNKFGAVVPIRTNSASSQRGDYANISSLSAFSINNGSPDTSCTYLWLAIGY